MEAIRCKNCGGINVVKDGQRGGKQSFECKDCKSNFVQGDKRARVSREQKYLMLLLFGKLSYAKLGLLFNISKQAAFQIIQKVMKNVEEKILDEDLRKSTEKNVEATSFNSREILGHLSKRINAHKSSDWIVVKVYLESEGGEVYLLKPVPEGTGMKIFKK